MSYKEWCDVNVCFKMRGNAFFEFKKLDGAMCLLKVSPIGEKYDYVELHKLELHNWFNACVIIPNDFAFSLYDCL